MQRIVDSDDNAAIPVFGNRVWLEKRMRRAAAQAKRKVAEMQQRREARDAAEAAARAAEIAAMGPLGKYLNNTSATVGINKNAPSHARTVHTKGTQQHNLKMVASAALIGSCTKIAKTEGDRMAKSMNEPKMHHSPWDTDSKSSLTILRGVLPAQICAEASDSFSNAMERRILQTMDAARKDIDNMFAKDLISLVMNANKDAIPFLQGVVQCFRARKVANERRKYIRAVVLIQCRARVKSAQRTLRQMQWGYLQNVKRLQRALRMQRHKRLRQRVFRNERIARTMIADVHCKQMERVKLQVLSPSHGTVNEFLRFSDVNAICIQALARRWLANRKWHRKQLERRVVHVIAADESVGETTSAAIMLQKVARLWLSRRKCRSRRATVGSLIVNAAATQIQCAARMWFACKNIRALRNMGGNAEQGSALH